MRRTARSKRIALSATWTLASCAHGPISQRFRSVHLCPYAVLRFIPVTQEPEFNAMAGRQNGGRDNFLYLIAGLTVWLVVAPLVANALGDIGILIASTSLTATLAIALWSLLSSRWVFFFGVAIVVLNAAATAIELLADNQLAGTFARLLGLLFFVLCSVSAARAVFGRGRVDFNKIVGALCVYLLIGAIWASCYLLLNEIRPGSFSGLEEYEGPALTWRMLYFSFVTLTTLGFGDVLPLNIYAETLVFLEAVLGQFYLAVLVAALVGAYLGDREKSLQTKGGDRPGGGTI